MTPAEPTTVLDGAPSVERQLHDLRVVLDVARAMAAAGDLDELLGLILDALKATLGAERATLFLYDAEPHELYKYARDGEVIRFGADLGIAGAAATTGRTINVPDAYADPRFNPEIDRQTGSRTRCLVAVPLIGLENRLVGVVQGVNKIDGVFTAYDLQLTEALAAQVAVAIQRARLLDHFVRKKQIEAALAIACDIQRSLLPREPPAAAGYDLAGWNQPADETGGDVYDFVPLPGGRIALSVSDATGHGIGPALMACQTRALLRAIAGHVATAPAILAEANRWLCADQLDGRFVTTFLGVLDPAAHRLDHASAGHGPLFWYRAADGTITTTGATGLPLGIIDAADYEPAPPFEFAPGDLAVFLTDGFVEAHDRAGRLFGEPRMTELIIRHADRPAAELIGVLRAEVARHMDGGPQLDDLTAVVVKRRT